MPKPKIMLSWSSGKDCAIMLYKLQQKHLHEIAGLISTINKNYERVAMHAVREQLLEQQASNLNLSLYNVKIPVNCTDKIYQARMSELILKIQKLNITHIAFGDIFLEDIKKYREQQLAKTTIKPIFPLWGKDSKQLAKEIITSGLKAIVTCIDLRKMPAKLIGHEYNTDFIDKLPTYVDPCGENGEFHTFVYDAPNFSKTINIKTGETKRDKDFLFIDLLQN